MVPRKCPQPRDLTLTTLPSGSAPSLKEAAQGPWALGDCPVVPWVRLCGPLPGSSVFQHTGRGRRSVTSGSCSEPFLPPPCRVALASKLYGWLPGRTSALARPVSGGPCPSPAFRRLKRLQAPVILFFDWLLRKNDGHLFFPLLLGFNKTLLSDERWKVTAEGAPGLQPVPAQSFRKSGDPGCIGCLGRQESCNGKERGRRKKGRKGNER